MKNRSTASQTSSGEFRKFVANFEQKEGLGCDVNLDVDISPHRLFQEKFQYFLNPNVIALALNHL